MIVRHDQQSNAKVANEDDEEKTWKKNYRLHAIIINTARQPLMQVNDGNDLELCTYTKKVRDAGCYECGCVSS